MRGSETIQELGVKGKAAVLQGIGEWGLFALITLAILASFGLGRLSVLIEAKPLVEVRQAALPAAAVAPGGMYVASRNGSTYYFPWCAGAERIAQHNQRWFSSETDAQKAGFRPAKNCKGLDTE